jgi:hypothetical protein
MLATKEKELFEASILFRRNFTANQPMKCERLPLKECESLDGKEAYAVEYVFPTGGKSTHYFDKETLGLKLQSVKEVKTPQGN